MCKKKKEISWQATTAWGLCCKVLPQSFGLCPEIGSCSMSPHWIWCFLTRIPATTHRCPCWDGLELLPPWADHGTVSVDIAWTPVAVFDHHASEPPPSLHLWFWPVSIAPGCAASSFLVGPIAGPGTYCPRSALPPSLQARSSIFSSWLHMTRISCVQLTYLTMLMKVENNLCTCSKM